MALMLRVGRSPSPECALTNLVYVHPLDADKLEATALREYAVVNNNVMGLPGRNYVMIKSLVFNYAISKTTPPVEQGCICLSPWQRQQLLLALGDSVAVAPYVPTDPFVHAWHLSLEVDWMAARKDYPPVDASQLKDLVTNSLLKQFVSREQTIGLHFEPAGANVKFKVANIRAVDWATLTSPMSPSLPKKSEVLTPSTTTASPARVETVNPDGSKIFGVEVGRAVLSRCAIIEIKRAATSTMKVLYPSSATPGNQFKQNNLDAYALGIGGLEREFTEKHVKGIILYGPPGPGKILMARQIGKMFNGKEPIVKWGPEMLNNYFGKPEENIRELFAEAEADFERNGDDAELHVIVIDELDSICRARGSGATGGTNVADSIVNQLLVKLDGVNQLNNLLLIGMTNSLDLIDEALTRPGRLEVKIKIGLPDEPAIRQG
ncbi:vesicle-fusing ATPase [Pelomyxa schiedti]|nr:vesicle-fusing ATPase [Pelomyxa schiedti]